MGPILMFKNSKVQKVEKVYSENHIYSLQIQQAFGNRITGQSKD